VLQGEAGGLEEIQFVRVSVNIAPISKSHEETFLVLLYKDRDPLTMSYFDNLDNELLNKYK
jgi:hypothetical protein